MGKGSTPSHAVQKKTLPDGRIGCSEFNCTSPATRWIDMERYGIRRWLSMSFCDVHGDWITADPHHTYRKRAITQ